MPSATRAASTASTDAWLMKIAPNAPFPSVLHHMPTRYGIAIKIPSYLTELHLNPHDREFQRTRDRHNGHRPLLSRQQRSPCQEDLPGHPAVRADPR